MCIGISYKNGVQRGFGLENAEGTAEPAEYKISPAVFAGDILFFYENPVMPPADKRHTERSLTQQLNCLLQRPDTGDGKTCRRFQLRGVLLRQDHVRKAHTCGLLCDFIRVADRTKISRQTDLAEAERLFEIGIPRREE